MRDMDNWTLSLLLYLMGYWWLNAGVTTTLQIQALFAKYSKSLSFQISPSNLDFFKLKHWPKLYHNFRQFQKGPGQG